MTTHELLLAAKAAAPALAWLGSEEKNAAILRMADAIVRETDVILAANEADVQAAKGAISDVMLDRLRLTQARIAAMADGMRQVAALPDPVGEVLAEAAKAGAAPKTVGELMQCVYNSLTQDYRRAVQTLQGLTGKTYTSLNIVGGGSQDGYLNQQTANATGLTVFAGPTEGTALGNLMVQFIHSGDFADLAEARAAIRRSFEIKEYQPE